MFDEADDLHAVRIVVLKISCQKNARTIDVRLCDLDAGDINIRREILEFLLFDDLAEM